MMHTPARLPVVGLSAVMAAVVLAFAGCGGSDAQTAATTTAATPAAPAGLAAARSVSVSDFPAAGGRSLQEIANSVKAGPQVGLASSVLLPGRSRVAFGLIAKDGKFLYGKSALYIASSPGARALGPFAAPADSMQPAAPFLSSTAAADSADIKAIYSTQVTFPKPGRYAVLAVNQQGATLLGAASEVRVLRKSPIPNVGDQLPALHTDTVAAAHGDLDAIDTRQPHDNMHKTDIATVIGKRPVALIIATPQLCHSRVCGPVTDLAYQLEKTYGDRMTFIHQEVYVANDANKGLRPPLRALGLQTEPWLFTLDRTGRIAARLEGAFGIDEMRQAIQRALL